MTALPPVLYWSASLAAHLNDIEEVDTRHGLIDFTVATVPLAWVGGDGWRIFRDLPADAVRLVAEAPAREVTSS